MIAANKKDESLKTCRSSSPDDFSQPPPWMRKVLLLAALYNIVWGLVATIAPVAMFRWMRIQPLPLYPEFWQCIGMIVGVYGIGYAIAARNPFRHWPIILVGLLGKIFGPIGFCVAVASGRLPAAMGWTILTNDLIWWFPFAIILWQAAKANEFATEAIKFSKPQVPLDPPRRMLSQYGASIAELSQSRPLLLVLLRHSGCTFCREALGDLSKQRAEIEGMGTNIALVHLGRTEPQELLSKCGLTDLHCFRDPHANLYKAFGLNAGTFRQLLGFRVFWRGVQATLAGHGFGIRGGNLFQMPGAFLIYRGNPVRVFRHRSAADRPNYVALARMPASLDIRPATETAILPRGSNAV